MPKLVIELQVQTYGEDEKEVLKTVRDTLVKVIELCDLSVGTFITSDIKDSDE